MERSELITLAVVAVSLVVAHRQSRTLVIEYKRYRIDPRLSGILGELADTPLGQGLADRLGQLVEVAGPTPRGDELRAAVHPHLGLLRATKGSLQVTKAGRDGLNDSEKVWSQLATRLVTRRREFDEMGALLRRVESTRTQSRAPSTNSDGLSRMARRCSPATFSGYGTIFGAHWEMWGAAYPRGTSIAH